MVQLIAERSSNVRLIDQVWAEPSHTGKPSALLDHSRVIEAPCRTS